MYRLQFTGVNPTNEQNEQFIIYVKADSQENAIQEVIDKYQATNIQVLE